MYIIMYEDSQLFDSWASIDTGSLCMVNDCPVVPSELSIQFYMYMRDKPISISLVPRLSSPCTLLYPRKWNEKEKEGESLIVNGYFLIVVTN